MNFQPFISVISSIEYTLHFFSSSLVQFCSMSRENPSEGCQDIRHDIYPDHSHPKNHPHRNAVCLLQTHHVSSRSRRVPFIISQLLFYSYSQCHVTFNSRLPSHSSLKFGRNSSPPQTGTCHFISRC